MRQCTTIELIINRTEYVTCGVWTSSDDEE
jgi:hypothetical protein